LQVNASQGGGELKIDVVITADGLSAALAIFGMRHFLAARLMRLMQQREPISSTGKDTRD
jgi:hypothetical protein